MSHQILISAIVWKPWHTFGFCGKSSVQTRNLLGVALKILSVKIILAEQALCLNNHEDQSSSHQIKWWPAAQKAEWPTNGYNEQDSPYRVQFISSCPMTGNSKSAPVWLFTEVADHRKQKQEKDSVPEIHSMTRCQCTVLPLYSCCNTSSTRTGQESLVSPGAKLAGLINQIHKYHIGCCLVSWFHHSIWPN